MLKPAIKIANQTRRIDELNAVVARLTRERDEAVTAQGLLKEELEVSRKSEIAVGERLRDANLRITDMRMVHERELAGLKATITKLSAVAHFAVDSLAEPGTDIALFGANKISVAPDGGFRFESPAETFARMARRR